MRSELELAGSARVSSLKAHVRRSKMEEESPGAVEIRCLRRWSEVAALQPVWRELVEKSPDATIFQSYEWHETWWQCFGRGAELFLLSAEHRGRIVAILPLMMRERRINGRAERVLELIGSGNRASDYCDAIVGGEDLRAVSALLRWLCVAPGWTMLDFVNIREDSPLYALVPGAFSDLGCLVSMMYEAPACVLGDSTNDRKLLGKKSFKRHVNYFKRNGDLSFRHYTDCGEALADLDIFFAQHIARRQMLRDRSLFHEEDQRDFYRALVKKLLPLGVLKFSSVLFNGEALAFHFGFEDQRRFIWYKPSFAVAWAKQSPGEVLLWHLLSDAVERGVSEFDFTVGEEDYKYRFSNKIRRVYRATIFSRPGSYYLMGARRLFSKLKGTLFQDTHKSRSSDPPAAASSPGA